MKFNRATQPKRRNAVAGVLLSGLIAVGGTVALAPVAAADPAADAAAVDWKNYEKVLLTKDVGEPIDLAILPDNKVLHTARNGDIRLTDPSTGITKIINHIPVYANSEDGLQSIALDPNFAENNWVYITYAPVGNTPAGNAPNSLPAGQTEAYWDQWKGVNRLSRFQWDSATNSIDLASEQEIIDVEVQRGQCCHVGADMDWDADGNLYLSTGDNTPASTPGANGFAPNNDAPGMNPGFDSRRGAGNTNDLRGKILRIDVLDEIAADAPVGVGTTYTIPEGNLFPVGTEKTRPEIFVMGVRNPFRIEVDDVNGILNWGDYGPDATESVAATAGRGPMGLVEWNAVKVDQPVNAGWPYVQGNNFAYNEWNFATATPGAWFDPANLKNNSRWNTGLVDLPDPTPATIWYGDAPGDADQPFDEFVTFGTSEGQAPMSGPTYQYDAANPNPRKFPEYWHNKAFFGEFSQDYLAAITADWDTLEVSAVEDFLPNSALTANFQPINDNPMDLEFGSDGSLYVLEYGDGFFTANPDAGLYRIDYVEGNKSPQAAFTATPISSSEAPLTVAFNAAGSTDPENQALTYEWDFDGDGTFDATGVTAEHTYTELGIFTARLRVTDTEGATGLTSRSISVGNQAPEIEFEYPGNGSFFEWGDAVPFKIVTNDAEDGTATNCAKVSWTYGLGHDEHAHPESSGGGCTGALPTDPNSPEHGPGALLYGVAVVNYTDAGHNGLGGATGETNLRINPKLQQPEHAIGKQGVEVVNDDTASGGRAVTGLGAGDFLRFDPVNFTNIDGVKVRAKGTGEVQFRWNAADAAPFAVATIPTNSGAGWSEVEVPFTQAPGGSGQLFVTSADNLSLDSLEFQGVGVADTIAPTVSHVPLAPPTGVGGVYNQSFYMILNAADNGAVRVVQYSLDGGTTWNNAISYGVWIIGFEASGTYDVLYRAVDMGGLVSEVGSVSFVMDLDAPNAPVEPTVDSTTTATVPAATVTYGNPGSVTVAVAGAGGTPSGDVVLTVGDTEIGTGTLTGGSATIELVKNLPVGTHTLTATYGADTTFKGSAGTVRLTVAKAGSVVTASVSPNPVKPAIAAKVTVHAESSTGVAGAGTITVLVKRGISTVATLTGTPGAEGNVVVTLPKLAAATYSLTVTHAATANTHAASTSTSLLVRA